MDRCGGDGEKVPNGEVTRETTARRRNEIILETKYYFIFWITRQLSCGGRYHLILP